MTNVARLQLSLSDIARLADVRRPVVSMWRQRPLASHAFPSPVGLVGGEERFEARAVADYLAATSRGNNPEASEDLVAHAKLAQVADLDEVVSVHGVTALLCLATTTGEPLGSLARAELGELADAADPHDTFLAREIESLGADLEKLAAYADELANASYSVPAAFERLLRRHAPAAFPGHAATTLAPAAQLLVARTAKALAADAGVEDPFFIDVTDGSGDLLLKTTIGYAGEPAPSVATLALDSPIARLARRRLRVHDVHRRDVVTDDAGDFAVAGDASDGAVHVLQLPPAGASGLSDLDVLDAVGNLIVQLCDDSRVVVIGPASALTDRPANTEMDLARDAVVRGDRLRAAIRLPKGLLARAPRRAMALWALGPAHAAIPVRDRWTVVADVSDQPLDEGVIDSIVTDVVAAMTPDERSVKAERVPTVAGDDSEQVLGHQFRFARRVSTASLLPGRKPLVDVAVRRSTDGHSVSGVDLAALIDRRVTQLGSSALAALRVEATAAPGESPAARSNETTIGQAVTDGNLRALAGNRLNAVDVAAGSDGLAVIGAAEVLGESLRGSRRIDLLSFAARYSSGRLTEPGDVIICTSPLVGAYVDTAGGAVVQAPARVLRITGAGRTRFLPSVLAADVKAATGPAARDWRRCPVRVLTSGSVEMLVATTTALDREREALLARVTALDDLASALIDGAVSGAVTITQAPSTTPQTAATEGP